VIYGEFLVRRALGEAVEPAEYLDRFPQFAAGLRAQFALFAAMDTGASGTTEHPSAPPTEPSSAGQAAAGALTEVPGYEVLGELGRGGMGVVYPARHLRLNRPVALKMVLAGTHAGDEELARFRVEAEAVARLRHPNIVQIYEIGEADGKPFFALEFVEGGSLAGRLGGTPQPAGPTVELVETLARAMHYAHERGIVHRDRGPGRAPRPARRPGQRPRPRGATTSWRTGRATGPPGGRPKSGSGIWAPANSCAGCADTARQLREWPSARTASTWPRHPATRR
jgi:hypothetical protein